MGVSVTTTGKAFGKAWAAARPKQANDLVVVATFTTAGKRKRVREIIGADNAANRAKAELRQRQLELAHGFVNGKGGRGSGSVHLQFRAMSARYVERSAADNLAATTREDRRSHLQLGGLVDQQLGDLSLDAIDEVAVLTFAEEFLATGKSVKTLRNYLDSISAVFRWARRSTDFSGESPVPAVRAWLKERSATKAGRAEISKEKAHPIEEGGEIASLIDASRELATHGKKFAMRAKAGRRWEQTITTSMRDHVALMLMLELGLRQGEASGLAWDDINFGNADGEGRSVRVHQTRPRGGRLEPTTKSGRERKVEMSRRIASLLREYYLAQGRPDGKTLILGDIDKDNWRNRHWNRSCEAAGIGRRLPKDLRDTFASQLISAAVPLAYVSKQLGHATIEITARHYARWCGSDYVAPPKLRKGMVPADLLAEIAQTDSSVAV